MPIWRIIAQVTLPTLALWAALTGVALLVGRASYSRLLAFDHSIEGNNEVYIADVERRLVHLLMRTGSYRYSNPIWEPGGTRIAFQSSELDTPTLYIMDYPEGDVRRFGEEGWFDGAGAVDWSPDSQYVVFASDSAGQNASDHEIFVLDAGCLEQGDCDKRLRRLTDNTSGDYGPEWSPSGAEIAFMSTRDGNDELYVMNSEGEHVRRLTHHQARDWLPMWSPDGKWIAFVSDREGSDDLYLMEAECVGLSAACSNRLRRLTYHGASDYFPDWSPDSRWIAFTSNRDGDFDIYLLDVAEALAAPQCTSASSKCEHGVYRFTDMENAELAPGWRP